MQLNNLKQAFILTHMNKTVIFIMILSRKNFIEFEKYQRLFDQ